MAMSREIPINVHPEFRWRRTTNHEDRGKSCTFTRSSSLPCEARITLVGETSNPSDGDKKQESKEENTAENPKEGGNDTERNKNDKFSEFWSLPDHPMEHKFSEAGRLNVSEEKGQRRHFFAENPVVGDLVSVFEDYYTAPAPSRPIKLGRRNTYGPGSSGESHLAPKLTRRNSAGVNRDTTSFNIPIHVEFDERKDGDDENEGNVFNEGEVPKENAIWDEGTTMEVSEAENKQIERAPKKNKTFDEKIGVDDGDNKDEDCVLEKPNDNSEEYEVNNIDQGQTESNEEQCEQLQSPSPLQPQHTEAEHDELSKKKLLKIQSILKKADDLEKEVNAFNDSSKTKEYWILEEVLTCYLIELDGIDANQNENVRMARKKGVQLLQQTLARLEGKLTSESVENKKGDKKVES